MSAEDKITMTDVKEAKRELEIEILSLLKEFQKATGTSIVGVNIPHHWIIGDPQNEVYNVEVVVQI